MAGLIRQHGATRQAAFSFSDLEGQASDLLAHARAEAQRLIADARCQADQLRQAAVREGAARGAAEARRAALETVRRESFDKALSESRQHLTDLGTSLANSLDGFERAKSALIAASERRVIELAIAIARRVCKVVVTTSPLTLIDIARGLLDMARHEHDLQLHVSVSDYAMMKNLLPELIASADRLRHVEVIANPSIDRGDCRIESASGTIDASIATQIDRVANALCDGIPTWLTTAGTTIGNQPPAANADADVTATPPETGP